MYRSDGRVEAVFIDLSAGQGLLRQLATTSLPVNMYIGICVYISKGYSVEYN